MLKNELFLHIDFLLILGPFCEVLGEVLCPPGGGSGRPWSDRDWEIRFLQNGMDTIEKNNFESLHPNAPKRPPRDPPYVPRGPQDAPKMPPGGSQDVSQSPPMWPARGPGDALAIGDALFTLWPRSGDALDTLG